MTTDDRARLQLLRRLEEVLGPAEAETLVTHLPPQPWPELATKADLLALEERLDAKFEAINGRFDGINHQFEGRFDGVNHQFEGVNHQFASLRHELLGAIDRAFHKQTWALVATMIALVTLMFAAIQLGR